jgi:hypothetical protein
MIVTTWCHEPWAEAALRAVLAQDWPDLEVVVYDDASPDGTWARLEQVLAAYAGPHRVIAQRQPARVGACRNGCDAIALASGEWLVFADGDDVSEPGRVRALVEAGLRTRAGLVSSNALLIDEQGTPAGLYLAPSGDRSFDLLEIVKRGWRGEMLGASFAFRRELFDVFGSFDPLRLPTGVDHVLPVRAAVLFPGGMHYLDAPLLRHRQHPRQQTQEIHDLTQSELVFQETKAAVDVTCALQCLSDLEAARRGRPEDAKIEQARQICAQRVMLGVQGWTRLRSELIVAGMRPTWTGGEAMAAREARTPFTPAAAEARANDRARRG